MYNAAFRILRERFEAEDVMQEAFLAAFTKIASYKGEVTFGAWLKRIVINKSLSQLKKNNRYDTVKMEVIQHSDIEANNENIPYTTISSEQIMEKLNLLKDNYRIILTLHLIEGFDYEEIEGIMKYSNQNVRTTISRAKKKLQQLLVSTSNKKTIDEK